MEGQSADAGTRTKQGDFYRLPLLDLNEKFLEGPVPLGPESLLHGVLQNGMKYYVRPNQKPAKRAQLALVVNIGSVAEEEEERGVAHICEHLAFNGTENYSNHDIVKFLESIGAQFGACQNAYTSSDETVYELLVPTDREEVLHKAFEVFAEFACKVRIAAGDVAKERGAVLEEWRQGRDARGRAMEAHWKLVMQGSRYADRLPIGLEQVIREATPETIRGFYTKWYRPDNMAVVVVGDFPDPHTVVAMLEGSLGKCTPPPDAPVAVAVPSFTFAEHSEPRFSAYVDRETNSSLVYLSFKHQRLLIDRPSTYRLHLIEDLFCMILNQRFFKISRKSSPPFYHASTQSEELARGVQSCCLTAQCAEGGIVAATRALLLEAARARLHPFSARELRIAVARLSSDLETSYVERHQAYSQDLCEEYTKHFLCGEFVADQVLEARLARSLLPTIALADLQAYAQHYAVSSSCVCKAMEYREGVSPADLERVCREVEAEEAAGAIPEWTEDEDIPEHLMAAEAEPTGAPAVASRHFPLVDCTEVTFPNGLRVVYKKTDLLDDQVLVQGFASGGLSEVEVEEYDSKSCCTMLANELGVFGFKPEVLADILAGKRCNLTPSVKAFERLFSGDQSPQDLESALQLIYLLFTVKVRHVAEDLAVVMQMSLEAIRNQFRDPMTVFTNEVRRINYGGCYYFRPLTPRTFQRVNGEDAVDFYSACFSNPAEFTVVLVGALDVSTAVPLMEKYLGGIPEQSSPPPRKQSEVTQLPWKFPEKTVRKSVKLPMQNPMNVSQITFPMELEPDPQFGCIRDCLWMKLATRILETRLLELLRFKYGKVYTVQVYPSFNAEAPSRVGPWRGEISVHFSCGPDAAEGLSALALDEVQALQEAGPDAADIQKALELERRQHELSMQENTYWMDIIAIAYKSTRFSGEVDNLHKARERIREEVFGEVDCDSMKDAFRRIFPYPARDRCTVLTLEPRAPWYCRPSTLVLAVGSTALAAYVAAKLYSRYTRTGTHARGHMTTKGVGGNSPLGCILEAI